MGRLGMSDGSFKEWQNPRAQREVVRSEEGETFEERVERLSQGEGVKKIIKDSELTDEIREQGYLQDEETCEDIAKRHGVDTAMVAAIAERLLKKDKGKEHIH